MKKEKLCSPLALWWLVVEGKTSTYDSNPYTDELIQRSENQRVCEVALTFPKGVKNALEEPRIET